MVILRGLQRYLLSQRRCGVGDAARCFDVDASSWTWSNRLDHLYYDDSFPSPVSRSPEATCPTLTRTEQRSTRPPLRQYQQLSSLAPRQSIPRLIRGPSLPSRTRTHSSTRPIQVGMGVGEGRALAALAGLTLTLDWGPLSAADQGRGARGRQLGPLNTWITGMSYTSWLAMKIRRIARRREPRCQARRFVAQQDSHILRYQELRRALVPSAGCSEPVRPPL
jgi:hypothetical protein